VIVQAVRDIIHGDEDERVEALEWIDTPDFFRVCEMASIDASYISEKMNLISELSKHLLLSGELQREYDAFKNRVNINIQMSST